MFKSMPPLNVPFAKSIHLHHAQRVVVVLTKCCLLNFIYSYYAPSLALSYTLNHCDSIAWHTKCKKRRKKTPELLLKCRGTDGLIRLEILHFELIILAFLCPDSSLCVKKISLVQTEQLMNVAICSFSSAAKLILKANDAILLQLILNTTITANYIVILFRVHRQHNRAESDTSTQKNEKESTNRKCMTRYLRMIPLDYAN